jgi:hypothetical protein
LKVLRIYIAGTPDFSPKSEANNPRNPQSRVFFPWGNAVASGRMEDIRDFLRINK